MWGVWDGCVRVCGAVCVQLVGWMCEGVWGVGDCVRMWSVGLKVSRREGRKE